MKNANGKGSIYFEKSRSKWVCAYTESSGKRVTKRFNTKQEAEEFNTVTRASMINGDYVESDAVTVGQWLAQYLELYRKPNVKPKTYLDYLTTAEHLAPLHNVQLQKLTASRVQMFYTKLKGSQSLLTKIHNLLKSAYTKAHQLDMVRKNVMLLVTSPKGTPPKEIDVFTTEEVTEILSFVNREFRYKQRYYPLIMCAFETGMRLGEILALRRNDITSDHIKVRRTLSVVGTKIIEQTPKTATSSREITISPELRQLLLSTRKEKVIPITSLVFSTKDGNFVQPRLVERTWKSILEHIGIRYRKFHCIRHTLATTLMANGVAPNDVAARLGHAKASTTMNMYGHAMPGVAEKLPELIQETLGIKRKSIV